MCGLGVEYLRVELRGCNYRAKEERSEKLGIVLTEE